MLAMTITIEPWAVTLLVAVVTALVTTIIWAVKLETRLENRCSRADERHDELVHRVTEIERELGKFYVFKPPKP